jgi:hypothetical protein
MYGARLYWGEIPLLSTGIKGGNASLLEIVYRKQLCWNSKEKGQLVSLYDIYNAYMII